MTAAERIKERLDEIRRSRVEHINKIEELIQKWSVARDQAQAKLKETANQPEQLRERSIAKVQVDEANAQIADLQAMLKLYKKEAFGATPEETEELFSALAKETLVQHIAQAKRALQLQRELFDIARNAVAVDSFNESLIDRWQINADASIADTKWKYRKSMPGVITSYYGNDVWANIFSNGIPDTKGDQIQSEINHMQNALEEMN